MSAPGRILHEIHRLKRNAADLTGKIEQGPRHLKARQSALSKQEDVVKQTQDEIKHFKVAIHDKEVSVKVAEQHIAKLEKTEITNKKEYDALRAEIAGVRKTIRTLEDEILELMGHTEDKTKLLPEFEKAVDKARAEAAQLEKDHLEKMDRFLTERTRTLEELQKVESTLQEDIRAYYDRLNSAKGEDALAEVQGTICAACYTEVTAQMVQELSRGQFVLCKNCGRMLYMAR